MRCWARRSRVRTLRQLTAMQSRRPEKQSTAWPSSAGRRPLCSDIQLQANLFS